MSHALLDHVQQKTNSIKKNLPKIRSGLRVKVHQKILENTKDGVKERIQIFEGLVIGVSAGRGADKTFRVRKISGGVGVEKIFPLHSTNINKIEVVGDSKVRRAKLYFMRERTGKSARLREAKLMGYDQPVVEEEALTEEAIQEAVAAEEARQKASAEKEGAMPVEESGETGAQAEMPAVEGK